MSHPKPHGRSKLWNLFTPDGSGHYATCSLCKRKFSYKTTNSNLRRHLISQHPTVLSTLRQTSEPSILQQPYSLSEATVSPHSPPQHEREPSTSWQDSSISEPENPFIPMPTFACASFSEASTSSLTTSTITQGENTSFIHSKLSVLPASKINDKLMLLFIKDYQPFSIVEDEGFHEFVKELNPSYELPNKNMLSNTILPALYEECLIQTKERVRKVKTVCITTDTWTSANTENFIAVTAHFINSNFELNSLLLKCIKLPEHLTSDNLSNCLKRIVSEWEITDKIMLAVTDNTLTIKSAITNKLKWKHIGCFAHSLDLVVEEGLKIVHINILLAKVRAIVTTFKRSCIASEKLKDHQLRKGQNPLKLLDDVPARWNSTFYMLQRITVLEESLKATIFDTGLPNLSTKDWKLTRDLVQVLKPFETIIKTMIGEKYVAASMIIPLVLGLDNVCATLLKKDFSEEIKEVVHQFKTSISEIFGYLENNSILTICTFLDPRFKTLAFKNENVADTTKNRIIEMVSACLEDRTTLRCQPQDIIKEENQEDDSLSVWHLLDKSLATKTPQKSTLMTKAIIEVNRYLEDDVLPRNEDPLKWWKEHQYNYPHLGEFAQDQFCVVATSVPCERIFSKAGILLSDRRNRLSKRKAEMLLFLNSNY